MITTQSNPIFAQIRVGKDDKLFNILKFKTMKDIKLNNLETLMDKDRITNFGNFLRKTSLDEIPQLLNVLKGEMSLIGPRPLLKEYLPLYSEIHARRHEVRPGITGWAQINGRNKLSWGNKFDYDIWYINHISFLLDLKITSKDF